MLDWYVRVRIFGVETAKARARSMLTTKSVYKSNVRNESSLLKVVAC